MKTHESNENYLNNFHGNGLKNVEKIYIQKILEENNWNKLKVSRLLGIDRKSLYKKIRELILNE